MKMRYIWMMAGLLLILAVIATIITQRDYVIQGPDGDIHGTHNRVSEEKIVLIIAGSGPTDRDGNSGILGGRNDSLKEISKALNQGGYSTFTYDKRSSGKSVQSFILDDVIFEDFVDDARLVLEELKRLGYRDISIIGHSQGALIAEMIGTDEQVSHIISLCGTIRPIDEVLKEQLSSLDNETFQAANDILNNLKKGQQPEKVPESLTALFGGDNRFLLSWISLEPMVFIKDIEDKLLLVYGEADSQISADEMMVTNEKLDWVLIADMNHVLKTVQSESENEKSYSHPIYSISDDLVDEVLNFLQE